MNKKDYVSPEILEIKINSKDIVTTSPVIIPPYENPYDEFNKDLF